MDREVILSYVMTTFNKLPYLQSTLPHLVKNCLSDEEIVIVDGGSTDGTVEYLSELHGQGKIHQFISEKDFGEAHGTNKAILMAKGRLIKIVTDDDAYALDVIQRCRKFMLENEDVDVLGSDGLPFSLQPSLTRSEVNQQGFNAFQKWKQSGIPFCFSGLSLLLRKNSLPILGLLDSNFVIVDFEYTLRVTASKARLAWFNGCYFANIVNPNSNSAKYWTRLHKERIKLGKIYEGQGNMVVQYWYSLFRLKIGLLKRKLFPVKESVTVAGRYVDIIDKALIEIRRQNSEMSGSFYK